jgi:V/A-type H+-transporting ATPase subunit I
MRIDVEKWIFAGLESEKASFFQRAQEIGVIEFSCATSPKLQFQHESVIEVLDALKILKHVPALAHTKSALSLHEAMARLVELKHLFDVNLQKIKELESEKRRLEPFGVFSRSSLNELSQKLGYEAHLAVFSPGVEDLYECLILVNQVREVGYGLWVSPEPAPSDIEFFRFEKDHSEVVELIESTKKYLKTIEEELSQIKSLESDMNELLFDRMDQVHLDWSKDCSSKILEDRLFYVEGWVPSNQVVELKNLVSETSVWAHPVKADENEVVPTYLKNNALGQIGQDLVGVYDIPSNTDKDPSLWVLGFFALFFSIIIGDGGYGFMFLAVALWVHFKFPNLKGVALRMKRLGMILSLGCIFWGFVTCSFFAISFDPANSLRQSSLLHKLSLEQIRYHVSLKDDTYQGWVAAMPRLSEVDVQNPQKMSEEGYKGSKTKPNYVLINGVNDAILKEFALFIGIIHLFLSLARYARRTWASFGWMLFLVGSWLYFPSVVKATTFVNYLLGVDPLISTKIGLDLIYVSLGLSFGLSLIQNKIYGLLEVMNLLQVFSDVLSYLRLYALGLAGAIMSATFNDMAEGSGVILGFFILCAGHSVNLVLGIMGGVIHGLRLNFLEWYHYSFSGAGRWLRPLKKIKESSL